MIKKNIVRTLTVFILFIFLFTAINAATNNNDKIFIKNNLDDNSVDEDNKNQDDNINNDSNNDESNAGNKEENKNDEESNTGNKEENKNDEESNNNEENNNGDINIDLEPDSDEENTNKKPINSNKPASNINDVVYKQIVQKNQMIENKHDSQKNAIMLFNSLGTDNIANSMNSYVKDNIDNTIIVKSNENLNLSNRNLKRSNNFQNAPLFKVEVNGKLILNNVTLDGKNINVSSNASVIYNQGEVVLNDTIITNHNLEAEDKIKSSTILNDGGKLEVRNSKIKNNKNNGKQSAGAILIKNKANVIVKDSQILNNKGELAGAILINDGKLTLDKATISKNHSLTNGGAINAYNENGKSMDDAAYLDIKNATITKNQADANGGGINLDQGAYANISKVQLIDNFAKVNGGGLFMDDRYNNDKKALHDIPLELKNVVVNDNEAFYYGGAMYLDYFAKVDIYSTAGLAIYNNNTSAGGESIYLANRKADNYSININERIFGGSKNIIYSDDYSRYNDWSTKLNNGKFPKDDEGNSNLLKLKPENTNNLEDYADVLIKNNKSAINGGGLAINGKVMFGEDSSKKIKVDIRWENKAHINYEYSHIKLELIRELDKEVVETVDISRNNHFKYEFNNLPSEFNFDVKEEIKNGDINYKAHINKISKDNEQLYIITYSEIE